MSLENSRQGLSIKNRLGSLMGIEIGGSNESVLLSVDAEDDPVILHRREDLTAYPFIHRNTMLRVRRAVGRVIFTGSEEARLCPRHYHGGSRLAGEVERDDKLIKSGSARFEQFLAVSFDRSCRLRVRSRDPRDSP